MNILLIILFHVVCMSIVIIGTFFYGHYSLDDTNYYRLLGNKEEYHGIKRTRMIAEINNGNKREMDAKLMDLPAKTIVNIKGKSVETIERRFNDIYKDSSERKINNCKRNCNILLRKLLGHTFIKDVDQLAKKTLDFNLRLINVTIKENKKLTAMLKNTRRRLRHSAFTLVNGFDMNKKALLGRIYSGVNKELFKDKKNLDEHLCPENYPHIFSTLKDTEIGQSLLNYEDDLKNEIETMSSLTSLSELLVRNYAHILLEAPVKYPIDFLLYEGTLVLHVYKLMFETTLRKVRLVVNNESKLRSLESYRANKNLLESTTILMEAVKRQLNGYLEYQMSYLFKYLRRIFNGELCGLIGLIHLILNTAERKNSVECSSICVFNTEYKDLIAHSLIKKYIAMNKEEARLIKKSKDFFSRYIAHYFYLNVNDLEFKKLAKCLVSSDVNERITLTLKKICSTLSLMHSIDVFLRTAEHCKKTLQHWKKIASLLKRNNDDREHMFIPAATIEKMKLNMTYAYDCFTDKQMNYDATVLHEIHWKTMVKLNECIVGFYNILSLIIEKLSLLETKNLKEEARSTTEVQLTILLFFLFNVGLDIL